jgi:hypothetical protein
MSKRKNTDDYYYQFYMNGIYKPNNMNDILYYNNIYNNMYNNCSNISHDTMTNLINAWNKDLINKDVIGPNFSTEVFLHNLILNYRDTFTCWLIESAIRDFILNNELVDNSNNNYHINIPFAKIKN